MQGEKPVSHARRDRLLEIEKQVQRRWEEAKVFEVNAPSEKPVRKGEKFFGNFPYPYMNGSLHLGHAFSFSKVEFAAAYHRLKGEKVLFPFGFHCTGMPIKACADKIAREIAEFGSPPVFPRDEAAEPAPPEDSIEDVQTAEPGRFKSKKSKAAAKTGAAKFQWEIMQSLGLKDDEIGNFKDPEFWMTYFPPLALEDLKALGLGCDWRRSFITTDYNPFYDSFVRWQMNTLKDLGKIVKDKRYTVYSPLDKQPCADHDRASGEGVQPQEYTLIKMKVKPPFTGKLKILEGKDVYLAAATLRPETMYGQTNAWVLPDGKYGAFEVNDTEVFVVTERAALNMAYQELSKIPEKTTSLLELRGRDLIGLPLVSPLACHPVIYALPLQTILTDKGTGIVTSVPSDAPDDYMGLHVLKSKPAFREKLGVKDEWVIPFELIPIINIPELGDKAAEKVCKDLKIASLNDKEKLAEAKRLTYTKGFKDGVLLVGEHKGKKVSEVKPLIKKMMVETNQAVVYNEPEGKVVSRSGEECVVALTDQWYLTYGEAEWKAKAESCLEMMELYHEETRNGFEYSLDRLNHWACSRSFGLGTRMPWDPAFLIESLSDSTIYMAYYTVAHILQHGDLYGKSGGPIKAEQMTRDVWDYLFRDHPLPDTDISPDLLHKMKQEFSYWYPFDLRASGKDLIQNHLTFSIYNHAAMFPKELWPRAFRCNGHIMLNSEKMSKSSGNFRTIRESIEEFSADATRFALADAGDSVDDANFVFETANSAILRLTKELTWMEEVLPTEDSLRKGPLNFADKVFENEINIAVAETEKNYDLMMFRDALKTGFYDLQTARDEYRLACGLAGMHKDVLWRYMDVHTRLITPVCPHYAEHVWTDIFRRKGFAIRAGFPAFGTPDVALQRANKYLQNVIIDFRKLLQKQRDPPKKTKKAEAAATPLGQCVGHIFVAENYGGWQEECLNILRRNYNASTQSFNSDQEILAELKRSPTATKTDFKRILSQCMPFIKFKKDETKVVGPRALDLKLPFGELQVLEENSKLIARQVGLEGVSLHSYSGSEDLSRRGPEFMVLKQSPPAPGKPAVVFVAVTEEPNPAGHGEQENLHSGLQGVHLSDGHRPQQ